jgi:hypothetical protein
VKTERLWRARSREYLRQIDRIDQQLEENLHDRQRLSLTRERRDVCREFVKLLTSVDTGSDEPAFFSDDGRVVRISIHIDGVPPKNARDRAKNWLKQRGVEWDGAAPALRHEIRTAIEAGDDFPTDMFGLFHEWTISIDGPDQLFLEMKAVTDSLLDAWENHKTDE